MPKTAMYEDYCTSPGEYQIRRSRKIFSVQLVAVPKAVSELPHGHFWLRTMTSNARHIGAATFWG
ncbi:hypothetical protein FHS21_003944 [Phyllobacterium trifolii]|uniref:Uncharacterized protein n=1 Tax=Phyllobacterium trifolii TaxID=300193 RepID=A0A839UFA0_9HYPH|nr:hypothetical protein [Phyllobacterium trifolii]